MSILLRGGVLVTLDGQRRVLRGDLYVTDGRIAALGEYAPDSADVIVDAAGAAVIPGLVQAHVHLCQTLFRGMADGLELLDWLRQRIWPLEAALDEESTTAAARLGCAELIRGGTTTVMDMGTVRHTDRIFETLEESGLRGFSGKCLMDRGTGVPAPLLDTTDAALTETLALLDRWDGAADGRLRYCLAPRFLLSCSERLLRAVVRIANDRGVPIHTHASESVAECARVEAEVGRRNIEHFNRLGLVGRGVVLAHCVHVSAREREILARTRTGVAHCPSANLKLGSGIAPVAALRRDGVEVGLGADGAACNNTLDAFQEMRLAALLQHVTAGPGSLSAPEVLEMATVGGARLLGLDREVGSLEVGKRADLAVVDLGGLHCAPYEPDSRDAVYSRLVYSARGADVRLTMVDGRILMQDGRLLTMDVDRVGADAQTAAATVRARSARWAPPAADRVRSLHH